MLKFITNKRGKSSNGRKRRSLQFEGMEGRQLMAGDLAFVEPMVGPIESPPAQVSTLQGFALAASASNNTMATAENFGTVTATSISKTGSVGGTDQLDYWKFRPNTDGVTSTGKIRTTIQLSGLRADVDVHLLDASGNVVARSARGGSSSESISVDLFVNRQYFVKVFPYGSANSDYRLTISTASANDSMAGASNIGEVYRTTRAVTGRVGGSDPADHWRFRPSGPLAPFSLWEGTVRTTIQLTGLRQDVDIHILDSSGRIVGRSTRGGSNSESVTLDLANGRDYFVKIFPYGNAVSDYRLTISTG
jgi:hypothetical protein